MPTVLALDPIVVSVPVDPPVRIATRLLPAREYLLVVVRTDDGVDGVGYAYAGTSGGLLLRAATELLSRVVVGDDASATERIWHAMYQEGLLLGRRGALLRAMSAIDIALWDAASTRAGLPLHRMLGSCRTEVPAYASGGYYRAEKDLDGLRRELSGYAELGFTDFKIKVGHGDLADDVARVAAARATVGDRARLALDANNAWRTPAEAIRAARAFEDQDIWWLEEPLGPDDVHGHARVREHVTMPVATGEIEATRWGFRDLLAAGAADVLQADAGVVGGVSEWMKIAHLAAAYDVPVAPHWHANIHAQLAGAAHNCLTVEYFPLEEGVYNFERLLAVRQRPRGGTIALPDVPGAGLVLDDDAVARFTVG